MKRNVSRLLSRSVGSLFFWKIQTIILRVWHLCVMETNALATVTKTMVTARQAVEMGDVCGL
jgi:hypothetical protein